MIASQKNVMEKKIFRTLISKSKNEQDSKEESNGNTDAEYYCLQELLEMKSAQLKSKVFEIISNEDEKIPTFFNVHKKKYMKNGLEKTMMQIIDVSQ